MSGVRSSVAYSRTTDRNMSPNKHVSQTINERDSKASPGEAGMRILGDTSIEASSRILQGEEYI